MPGIFGAIDSGDLAGGAGQSHLEDLARRMAVAMRHEPFHAARMFSLPALGACVGEVTLDATPARGSSPARGAPILIAAGERALGLPEPSGSGEELVRGLGGRCAAFVGDIETGRSYLVNDRYGRERIFLHTDGSRTLFASEAKAILAAVPPTRAFDGAGLAELFACGCTLGSRSLFLGIEVLEPGTELTFDRSGARRRRVFGPQDLESLEQVPGADFLEAFLPSLRAAVRRAVDTPPRPAVSLTGGLDSRMIMASLDAPAGTVPCYTFGSMYRTTGDVAVARKVAERCDQPHQVIELGTRFLAAFRDDFDHAVYASDGYLGLTGAAELHVNRAARAVSPSRVTGNWGGEVMRGVRAFKFAVPEGGFIRAGLIQLMRESAAAFRPSGSSAISGALFHQVPWQGYGRYAIERSQVMTRTPFLDDDVVQWLYRAPAEVRASVQAAAAVIGQRPGLLEFPTDAGVLGRGPAAVRREWRRAVIKAEYMTSHGAPGWLARLSAALPAALLETRFLGVDKFYHFRHWTRGPLAPIVRDILADGRDGLGEWFDTRRIESMVEDHIAGRANHLDAIDKLMDVCTARNVLFADQPPAALRPGADIECVECQGARH